jgi:DNA-binding FadR family transcriptional regulator
VEEWLLANRVRTPAGARRRPLEAPPEEGRKLAEVVADRMRDDIAADGWRVGSVVGSESDLLDWYGVSRAVLREAVRLLEYHAVARMRRGPGGGLLVTRPDPQASISTIALHLEYRKVGGDDLRVVRDAIELGALDRVLASTGRDGLDPAAVDRLRASAAHITDGPPGDPAKADLFHTVLAELAGNPVLVLFLRIITELFRAHTSAQEPPLPYDETAGEVRHAHERILSAVLDGDAGLARHRMRRHLEALQQWWH